jgi:hypothetical protein
MKPCKKRNEIRVFLVHIFKKIIGATRVYTLIFLTFLHSARLAQSSSARRANPARICRVRPV